MLLEVEELSIRYGRVHAVSGVSLAVGEGVVIGLFAAIAALVAGVVYLTWRWFFTLSPGTLWLGLPLLLAESWAITDEGRKVTFTLRPGLEFSDGSPLRAEDVADLSWQPAQSIASWEFSNPSPPLIAATAVDRTWSARSTPRTTVPAASAAVIAALISEVEAL